MQIYLFISSFLHFDWGKGSQKFQSAMLDLGDIVLSIVFAYGCIRIYDLHK